MTYARHVDTRTTPQDQQIPGRSDQAKNNAGGYVFAVDDWGRLDRFLVLGSEQNTYYQSAKELTQENAAAVIRCIREDGSRVVSVVADVSKTGRAPRNEPAIFALALALTFGDDQAKRRVSDVLPVIVRTSTHLFHFATYVKALRGWGPTVRRAIATWYMNKSIDDLAYQVVKYRQRDGWAHRDLLLKAHVRPRSLDEAVLFRWAAHGHDNPTGVEKTTAIGTRDDFSRVFSASQSLRLLRALEAVEQAAEKKDLSEVLRLVKDEQLPWEAVPSTMLGETKVWEALFDNLPQTALIRNLPTLTRHGILGPMRKETTVAVERLTSEDRLRRARVHPLQMLVAMKTYASGKSQSGDNAWTPVRAIVDALDRGFYASFGAVESTGKRILLALDVSGSMGRGSVGGIRGLSPRECAAALALVTANVEQNYTIVGFTAGGANVGANSNKIPGYSSSNAISELSISPRQRLDDVVRYITGLSFGGTDCALPMLWALEKKVPIDACVIFTDNETWAGNIHPVQALDKYSREMGVCCKLVVVGMTSSGFSIADQTRSDMLDVVGFDLAAPNVISDFIRGS